MSLAEEWIKTSLYAEEDCVEDHTIRMDAPMAIVGGACYKDTLGDLTTTSDYRWVVGLNEQGLPDCLRDAWSFPLPRDADTEMFVRAVPWHCVVCKTLCQGHHGPVLRPETFQPPATGQDWILEVSSLTRSFRNRTPSRQEPVAIPPNPVAIPQDLRSTDCIVLPSKYVVPDMIELPDADEMASLARGGRGIVGSEKTIGWDAAVTEPEVPGCTLGSCSCGHMGGWAG